MTTALLISATIIGFTHAFEVDHLVAVSNIVTNRTKLIKAIKDGLYWGLGHTSTIIVMSVFFLFFKYQINERLFSYLEASVGVMLIILGIYRLGMLKKNAMLVLDTHIHNGPSGTHIHTHSHSANEKHSDSHLPSYIIGGIHGLAGSGALLIVVIAAVQSATEGILYIFSFGVGSIGGMMLAAAAFGIPFSQKILKNKTVQIILIILSAILCIYFGVKIVVENL